MTTGTLGRNRKWIFVALACVIALVVGIVAYLAYTRITTHRFTAYFTSATGLYPGDDVRVLGVKVGKVDSVEPQPEAVKVELSVNSDVAIPEDARAVIIAQSLVSGRFVQLTPVYDGGPSLEENAEIPVQRTAVPVEWDDIKRELTKLSTALGPLEDDSQGSFGRFVNTAAENLDGNGDALKSTLHELSHTLEILSDGRTDLFATIRNLQAFVSALSNSNTQIVQFGNRLASVSEVLGDSSDELGQGLIDLDVALSDVGRFVTDNRPVLVEGVSGLAEATQVLVDKRAELEQVLHIAPNALANFYQIYKPAQGSLTGVVGLNEVASPLTFLCGSIEGMEANDSQRSADLCRQFLAPVFNSLVVNYPPIMTNPASGVAAFPDQIQYSPDELRAEMPQAVPVAQPPQDLLSLLLPGGGR
ncbi:MCE family protein [Antrihabitans sp. YC2-6]|uniref:MCE family protein n=1 Tax=Antrihabitans sp. YC2-6 TaxID=2799498 RepID=UPI0018F619E1|nr:MCE family protein [Antrihabitans sp. YC2-6]MBJ8345762.1 MCE family protein [Antrihabitans sp. YC2-6]